MDSPEPLLLAEGVCPQLKTLSYHPVVTTESPQPTGNEQEENAQMFGVDCRSSTKVVYLTVHEQIPVDISNYQQKLVLSLSFTELAQQSKKAQEGYKAQYDKNR